MGRSRKLSFSELFTRYRPVFVKFSRIDKTTGKKLEGIKLFNIVLIVELKQVNGLLKINYSNLKIRI